MFTEKLPSRNECIPAHIARMIALMGHPPKDLLDRGQRTERYFDEAGMWSTYCLGLYTHTT